MDEIERKRAYKTIEILIGAVEDVTIRNVLVAFQHMIMSLDKRIDEMQGDDDE
jgi:hypothetical protein